MLIIIQGGSGTSEVRVNEPAEVFAVSGDKMNSLSKKDLSGASV